ncbi:MAG: Asp-tRNA(Asn)/Glu-tRNA(Gln) amidotransferase subunit GatC [Candidatus Daviesbacteria bacterium]|nr:Asp-tRNA(Asn)/Glu-tRNA(Gln) amidotransferase subunit GatC [Candidatus Daviesbacteria bacterium]
MKLSQDQVKKVANLANLTLTSEEEDKYADQLSDVLSYIDQLNLVDTKSAEPTFNVTDLSNVLADDEITPSLEQDAVLQNASAKKDGFFVTKGVFENE